MKADDVELGSLFDTDVRYLVPIFQRNYKWDQKSHWGPLWEDLRAVADDVLEFGAGGDGLDHFLGAIVCEPLPAFGLDAKPVSVIDGQQRLTTLALFFGALGRVCQGRGFEDLGSLVQPSITNKDAVVQGREEHRYKVWPNVEDRTAFLAAMRGGSSSTRPERAIAYFVSAVDRWLDEGVADDPLDDGDYTPEERMRALVTAAMRRVKLVKIDLEGGDNAQLIFETLNGRGEKLTDADLIRNALFRLADQEGSDVEALHAAYWKAFDTPVWSAQIAHGRHQRDRLSLLLNYWLSMRMRKEVPASSLFQGFKDYVKQTKHPAEAIAKDLSEYGSVFEQFTAQPEGSREWWFFRRLAEMDLITVYPILLYLFGRPEEELPTANRRRALVALESFLVRRLLRRDSTRGYGSVFIDVLVAATDGPVDESDLRIIELLRHKKSDAERWPTDDEMRSAVLATNVYKLKQSRLKMVLEAVDAYRSAKQHKAETLTLGHALWIEHLLPQGWKEEEAWALPKGLSDPTRAALERDHLLHTLGNLTLTTSGLDISLSNRPWPDKLAELQKHTTLQLNRDLVDAAPKTWDEEAIAQRGMDLAKDVIAIWPAPDALLRERSVQA